MLGIDDAALAILAAGLASSAGSLYANSRNVKANRFANDVNYAIAQANNEAQIQLANTAHQREVFDLRAAGLNPILSAGGSGAATPSLTSARATPAQIDNPVNGLASSARDFARYLSDQYKADTSYAKSQADMSDLESKLSKESYLGQRESVRLANDKAQLEREAFDDFRGIKSFYDDKTGKTIRIISNPAKYNNAKRLQEDAIDASLRDASNVNWRHNLASIGGAATDATSVLTGAGALMRATNSLKSTRPYNNRR